MASLAILCTCVSARQVSTELLLDLLSAAFARKQLVTSLAILYTSRGADELVADKSAASYVGAHRTALCCLGQRAAMASLAILYTCTACLAEWQGSACSQLEARTSSCDSLYHHCAVTSICICVAK